MIYLEKGQKVADKPELVVYEQTGERNDVDMVICAQIETPDEPFCWLEAQYIAYGSVVYTINDDKELEKEILKIDPNTTINDAVGDVQNITTQNADFIQQTPQQSPSQNVIQQPEQSSATTASSTPSVGEPMAAQQQANVSTTTAPTAPVEVPVTSATSSEVVIDPIASSSPAVIPPAPVDPVSTSTPGVVPDVVPVPAPVLDMPIAPIEGATASTTDAAILSMAKRKSRRKVV